MEIVSVGGHKNTHTPIHRVRCHRYDPSDMVVHVLSCENHSLRRDFTYNKLATLPLGIFDGLGALVTV